MFQALKVKQIIPLFEVYCIWKLSREGSMVIQGSRTSTKILRVWFPSPSGILGFPDFKQMLLHYSKYKFGLWGSHHASSSWIHRTWHKCWGILPWKSSVCPAEQTIHAAARVMRTGIANHIAQISLIKWRWNPSINQWSKGRPSVQRGPRPFLDGVEDTGNRSTGKKNQTITNFTTNTVC